MSAAAFVCDWTVVLPGTPASDCGVSDWSPSVLVLGTAAELARLPDPSVEGFVWLHPRAVLDAPLREAVRSFGREGRPRVGVARHEADVEGGAVPLGNRVLVAEAGGARFSAGGPVAEEGAELVALGCTVRVATPARIGLHLRAVNAESSIAAAIGLHVGEVAGWKALALAPLFGTFRGWLGARGDRGRAFSVAFLESFARAAAEAKLWELRRPEEESPS